MATEVTVTGGTSISVSLNNNVLTTVETKGNSINVTQEPASQTVVSSSRVVTPLTVSSPRSNKVFVSNEISREVSVQAKRRNEISVQQGIRGLPGPAGQDGQDGQDGADGILELFLDPSPQLGAALDVNDHSIFTSVEGGDIIFTPSQTGYINLNGTVFFKEFDEAPDPFEGGMYRDSDNNLYFGV